MLDLSQTCGILLVMSLKPSFFKYEHANHYIVCGNAQYKKINHVDIDVYPLEAQKYFREYSWWIELTEEEFKLEIL